MGAETETDGRGDAMKRKRYKLYDNYTTYFILLGLGFYYVLVMDLMFGRFVHLMTCHLGFRFF